MPSQNPFANPQPPNFIERHNQPSTQLNTFATSNVNASKDLRDKPFIQYNHYKPAQSNVELYRALDQSRVNQNSGPINNQYAINQFGGMTNMLQKNRN
jgi:hypothetical protein